MTDAPTQPETVPAIERELSLAASPERVWRALTDPAELSAWFPQRADIQPVPGYVGWMEWDGYGRYAVRVEEVEPLRRFVCRGEPDVGAGVDAPGATTVEWTLTPRPDGGTILHLRESGFLTPEARAGNEDGWTEELAELTALLDRG
jgi:uncharacterized protein YndB with AHSA1/START domain